MKLILGGPGCGKTTALIKTVKRHLKKTEPERVGFIAFTKKAALEARERCATDLKLEGDDMVHFRTIHSMCFRQLGLNSNQVMQAEDYERVAEDTGIQVSGEVSDDYGLPTGGTDGDKCIFLEQLARSTGKSFEVLMQKNHLNAWQGGHYRNVLNDYKENRGLVDFTDMIEMFLQEGQAPDLDVLVVDEAQDLSALHWRVVDKLAQSTPVLLIGGDDDQAIFRWAGADLKRFLSLTGTKTVLPVSHRLPRNVFSLSNKLLKRISNRYKKTWQPREENGAVMTIDRFENLAGPLATGTWYCLARHSYLLPSYKKVLDWCGYTYELAGQSSTNTPEVKALMAWERLRQGKEIVLETVKLLKSYLHPSLVTDNLKAATKQSDEGQKFDANCFDFPVMPTWVDAVDMGTTKKEYYRKCLRNGEKLSETPRIKLSTVHGVKGGEADNVVVMPDMSGKANKSLLQRPDSEHRVFYVAVTRARHNLFLLHPNSGWRYEF